MYRRHIAGAGLQPLGLSNSCFGSWCGLLQMSLLGKVAIGLVLLAVPAAASKMAVLHNGFSIRHERSEVIGSVTRLFITADGSNYVDVPTADIDHFEKAANPAALPPSSRAGASLSDVVDRASSRQHLDPDLVTSVIRAESDFNPHAVSPKGAQGLMQLMPGTASQLGVDNAFDPKANVEGGTRYLRALIERYNFDLKKALAAYNAGPQRVSQYGGVPPYRETQAYVARIIRDFNRKKLAERKAAAGARSNPARLTSTATLAH